MQGFEAVVDFFPWVAGVFALCLGSFYNVVVCRSISGESVVFPPSHCPTCKARLCVWENIPVVSWLVLRGRCGHCGCPISIQYPALELSTAAWGALLAMKFGPSSEFLVHFLFGSAVLVACFIDFRIMEIPDTISIGGGVLAIPASIWALGNNSVDVLVAAFVPFALIALVMFTYQAIRKSEGMGMGDLKFVVMLGALEADWRLSFALLFVAALLALPVGVAVSARAGGMRREMPFGPYLGLAHFIFVLGGEKICGLFSAYMGV